MLRFVSLPVVVMLALAVSVSADGAERLRIVGISITGQPEELAYIPFGVLPFIPILYTPEAVRRTGSALARYFAENGYPYGEIRVSVIREGADGVILRFQVDLGEKVCSGPPFLIGAKGRADKFYHDVRIRSGRPYNAADVDETVRRLNRRPYVQSAEAMPPVIIEDGLLCCDLQGADSVDISSVTIDENAPCLDTSFVVITPIGIAEKYGMEMEGAVGYESGRGGAKGRWSGRLNLAFINMLRRGEVADVFYSGMNGVQKFSLSGSVPWVFGLPFEVGGDGGLEVEDGGYGHFSGELWGAVEAGGRWRFGAAVKGSETVPPDSAGGPYRFYGADVFLSLLRQPWGRGLTVWEFDVRTGSGAASREKSFARSNMELIAGVHYPVIADYALAGRVNAAMMVTDEDYLPPAELYRTGGHGSMRGYSEDEFAFRAVAFAQFEALYYFRRHGAVFIFVDGGVGFSQPGTLSLSSSQKMLGYGLGLRFPANFGTVSVEWARNMDDGLSLGRVHVGIRTNIQ